MRSGLFSPEVIQRGGRSRDLRSGFNEVRAIQPGSNGNVEKSIPQSVALQ